MKFSSRIDRIRSFASTYIYIERETWNGGQAGSFGHGTNKSTDLYLDVTVTAVTGKGRVPRRRGYWVQAQWMDTGAAKCTSALNRMVGGRTSVWGGVKHLGAEYIGLHLLVLKTCMDWA